MKWQRNVSRTLQKHSDSTSHLSGSLCESCNLVKTAGLSFCYCYWLHTWEVVRMCERESVCINVFILNRGNSKLLIKAPQADLPAYLACVSVSCSVGYFGPASVVIWVDWNYLLFSWFFLGCLKLVDFLPCFRSATDFRDHKKIRCRTKLTVSNCLAWHAYRRAINCLTDEFQPLMKFWVWHWARYFGSQSRSVTSA